MKFLKMLLRTILSIVILTFYTVVIVVVAAITLLVYSIAVLFYRESKHDFSKELEGFTATPSLFISPEGEIVEKKYEDDYIDWGF